VASDSAYTAEGDVMLIAVSIVAWACIVVGLWYARDCVLGYVRTAALAAVSALAFPSRPRGHWPFPSSRLAPLAVAIRLDPLRVGPEYGKAATPGDECMGGTIGGAGHGGTSRRRTRLDLTAQAVDPVQGIQTIQSWPALLLLLK
jgi:hypothetical protein